MNVTVSFIDLIINVTEFIDSSHCYITFSGMNSNQNIQQI